MSHLKSAILEFLVYTEALGTTESRLLSKHDIQTYAEHSDTETKIMETEGLAKLNIKLQ